MSKFKKNPIKNQTFEVYLECLGEKGKFAINMRVLAFLEEKHGTLNKAIESFKQGSVLDVVDMFAIMMSSGEGEEITADEILDNFTMNDFANVMKGFEKAFSKKGSNQRPKKTRR